MSRVVWFAAGAVSGAYALVKAKRTAQNLTPDGIGARVAALGLGARMFAGEVATAMATKEAELRAELHLSGTSRPALEPGADDDDHTTSESTSPSTDGEGRHDGHR